MIKKRIILGLTILLVGIIALMYNIKILTGNLLSILIGVYMILTYILYKHNILIYIGIILLGLGSVNILNNSGLIIKDIKTPGYLFILSFIALYIFIKKKKAFYFTLFSLLISISISLLSSKILSLNMLWLGFIIFGISFYINYIFNYKKSGIVWPKYISYIFIGVGIILLVNLVSFFKAFHIRYILPILIIIIGGYITYKNMNMRVYEIDKEDTNDKRD